MLHHEIVKNTLIVVEGKMFDEEVEKFDILNIVIFLINKKQQTFKQIGIIQYSIDQRFTI